MCRDHKFNINAHSNEIQTHTHTWHIDTQQLKKQMVFPSKELYAVCRLCAVSANCIHHFEAKAGWGKEDL